MPDKKYWMGISLYQPWATAVVEGRFPVLVRSIKTNIRGRILVIANDGIDGLFLFKLNDIQLKMAEDCFPFSRILGSIELIDCILCSRKNVFVQIKKLAGRKCVSFYPPNMLPKKMPNENVYLWILRSAIKLEKPMPIKRKSICWYRFKLRKEQEQKILTHSRKKILSFWDKKKRLWK